MKGNTSWKAGSAEKYEAGGGIELLNNKIDISATNTSAGITFSFKVKNNDLGTDSYLTNQIGYTFDKNHKLEFKTRKNKKTNLKEFYNLIYEYKNDCLVAAIEYNKDYYSDRDLKPNEELFFSLTIVPFSKISSPNTKQWKNWNHLN